MGNEIVKELNSMKEIIEKRHGHIKSLLRYPQHLHSNTITQLEIEEYTINSKIEIIEKATHRIKYSILNKE